MSDLIIDNDMLNPNRTDGFTPCSTWETSPEQHAWAGPLLVLDSSSSANVEPTDLPHKPMEQMMVGKRSTATYGSPEYRKLWAQHNEGIVYKRRIGTGGFNLYASVFAGLLMTFCAAALIAIPFI